MVQCSVRVQGLGSRILGCRFSVFRAHPTPSAALRRSPSMMPSCITELKAQGWKSLRSSYTLVLLSLRLKGLGFGPDALCRAQTEPVDDAEPEREERSCI